MVAQPSPGSAPRTGDFIVTRGGKTFAFDTAEDARAFVNQPLTDEEHERGLKALDAIEAFNREFLARRGGKGVSEDDFQDALRAMKEH